MYFIRVNLWYTNYISIKILKLKKNIMPLKSLLLIFTWDYAYPYMGLECVCAETDIDTHIYKYMNQNNTTSKLITENNEIFNFHTNPHGTWRNSRSLYNFSYIFITHVHVPCSFKWESTHRTTNFYAGDALFMPLLFHFADKDTRLWEVKVCF